MIAVETKSAQTVADDFLSGRAAFARLRAPARRRRPLERVVVYGGSERHGRSEAPVLPWSAVPDREWG
jgi:hypothetical protein